LGNGILPLIPGILGRFSCVGGNSVEEGNYHLIGLGIGGIFHLIHLGAFQGQGFNHFWIARKGGEKALTYLALADIGEPGF